MGTTRKYYDSEPSRQTRDCAPIEEMQGRVREETVKTVQRREHGVAAWTCDAG